MIYTKSVSLKLMNSGISLSDKTIQEADEALLKAVSKLNAGETIDALIEVTFKDNTSITETIHLSNKDVLVNDIIRYHLIGLIKYRAGLMTCTVEDVEEYNLELQQYDVQHYKNLFLNYSFFSSLRKFSRKFRDTSKVVRLIHKYEKKVSQADKLLLEVTNKKSYYSGLIQGLHFQLDQNMDAVSEYEVELNSLPEDSEKYHFLRGVLEGIDAQADL